MRGCTSRFAFAGVIVLLACSVIGAAGPTRATLNIGAAPLTFDSLKVKFSWAQPSDGLGNADSTTFRLRLSKPWRTYASTTTKSAGTWYHVSHTTAELADSLKLALGTPGDSVIFDADSIRQCRKGACSIPGSASFRYVRPVNPPPMTFLQIVTDSTP